jgi:hypothetical protein
MVGQPSVTGGQSSLAAVSGQASTFVRATSGTAHDSGGRLYTPVHTQARWDAVLNSVTGRYEQTLLLEPARTNLCLQSENFGTTWAAIGTPTRTAAAKTIGDLVLDLIGDDTAGTLEGYSQVIAFTGNAVKTIQVHLAAATSGSVAIRLRDVTGAANRLLAVITWSGGVPSVAMTTGFQIGTPLALAGGVYLIEFQTTSVTAANTNQLEVYPATDAALSIANTGTVYAGGMGAYDAAMGASYVKTTTATVTRNAEALSYTALWPQQDSETWYWRLARPRWADLAGSLTNALYGASRGATGSRMALSFLAATRTAQVEVFDGSLAATAAMPAGTGGFIELLAQFALMKSTPKCALDVGAGLGAFSSAGAAAQTAPAATITLGDAAWSAGQQLAGGSTDLVVGFGLQTMATMRAVAQR